MNKNNYFGGITRKAAVVALGVLLVVFAAVFPALAYADDVCGDLQNADTVTLLSCLEQTDTRLTQNAEFPVLTSIPFLVSFCLCCLRWKTVSRSLRTHKHRVSR